MTDDLRLAARALPFLALAAIAAWQLAAGVRRERVAAFLTVLMASVLLAGLLRVDIWPIAHWHVFYGALGAEQRTVIIRAVDEAGAEFAIDNHALEPYPSDHIAWLWGLQGPAWPQGRRDELGRWILARLNAVRAEVRERRWRPPSSSLLGPFAALSTLPHRRTWRTPDDVPATAFVGLRVYLDTWDADRLRLDRSRIERRLVFEYRPQ